VSRKKKRYQIYGSSWFRRIAATFLAGSIVQSPISTFAQKVPSPAISNQAEFSYKNKKTNQIFRGITSQIQVNPDATLIDPLGRILACGGQPLADYTGYSVALYDPDPNDPTGTELGQLTQLTTTELPDIEGNGVFRGLEPNETNINPFPLSNVEEGFYNFLFDPNRGQVDAGRTFILVVNPPENSGFSQRRVQLEINQSTGSIQNNVVRYTATSLDGQPISVNGGTQITDTVVFVPNAETVGLDLLAFDFDLGLCQSEQITITKTGDRATAEPGETAVYRLTLRNTGDAGLDNVVITDQFPLGFKFLPESVRGQIGDEEVAVTTEGNGSNVTFRTDATIPQGGVLNIVYAAKLTPDAVRGSGRNTATVNAERIDNDFAVKDGPASHLLKIRPGITSDCGTIIGRVFVDKNFDGEQQAGEPGVPNAVIFLENGNRITTDADGLYSVKNVLPGKHTGVLDLQSLPGYTLAPNVKFKERNSQSRLVNLEPGGMVRMNFAVTPSFGEEAKK
jgi:uncharacterized repeat protein (TIGR01451 family)